MKNLKNYIYESVWDVDNNVESDNNEFVIDKIKQFIKDNYLSVDLKRLTFVFDKEKEKYVVSYNGVTGVKLNTDSKSLVNDLFEWGTIKGRFSCCGCDSLESLKGAPERVSRSFDCSNCQRLETLKGAPEHVRWNFSCSGCSKLTSLEGAPKKVGGSFYCYQCPITSLKGAPKEVGGNFHCYSCPNLHSLDGIGKVKGEIISDIE